MMRLRAQIDRWRESLFFVPMLYVLGSLIFAEATLLADRLILEQGPVPFFLEATVESARVILGTVAGATITVAGIAFSVSLLLIQLASAQFSPRVLRGFFRDPVSKRAMGIAAGTFTYSLAVLRVVRVPRGGEEALVPYLSVLISLVMGLITLLAILHFISHSAHSMQAGEIIRRVMDETEEQLHRICSPLGTENHQPAPEEWKTPGTIIRVPHSGWLQQMNLHRLEDLCPEAGVIRIETHVGYFATYESPLCTVWPEVDEDTADRIQDCFMMGRSRTMQQDLGFGIRQLVDIGLRALSPGVNDPTTADEVIVHLGVLLRRLLVSDLPPAVRPTENGGTIYLRDMPTHVEFLGEAFDQLRRAGANQPAVVTTLLSTLGMLLTETDRYGLEEHSAAVKEMARLTLAGAVREQPLEEDRLRLTLTAERLGLVPRGGVPSAPEEMNPGATGAMR